MIRKKAKYKSSTKSNKKVWFDKDCNDKRKIYTKLRKKDIKLKCNNAEVQDLRKKSS